MNAIVRSRPLALALGFLLLGASTPGAAKELAGVKSPDTLSIAGKTLTLNGVGIRKKAIFKVYVGGLYLEAPSKDPATILGADASRAIRMTFMRSIEKEKLVEAFREGFVANTPGVSAAQKANMEKLLATVTNVKDGDVATYAYVPGRGVVVMSGEKEVTTIEGGKEFADAFFAIWLGAKPPSEDLKKGLLGQS